MRLQLPSIAILLVLLAVGLIGYQKNNCQWNVNNDQSAFWMMRIGLAGLALPILLLVISQLF